MTDDNERKIDELILNHAIDEVQRATLLLLRDLVKEHRDHSAQEMRLFKICAWLLTIGITIGGALGTFVKEDYLAKTTLLYELKDKVGRLEAGIQNGKH